MLDYQKGFTSVYFVQIKHRRPKLLYNKSGTMRDTCGKCGNCA